MSALATQSSTLALPTEGGPVQSLAFNRTGKLFAAGDSHRNLRAWHSGRPFFQTDLRSRVDKVRTSERIRSLAFSHDGRNLYVACGDLLRAFDLQHRSEAWRFQPRRTLGLILVSPVTVAVSPLGNVFAAMDSGNVRGWMPSGKQIAKWSDNDAPRFMAFHPNGQEIVGADGFTVSIWDACTGKRRLRVKSRERIFGLALRPSGELAVRTLHTVDRLSLDTLALIDSERSPYGLPLLAYSPDGSLLAVAGESEIIVGNEGRRLSTDGARVLSLAFHPLGSLLAAGCSDGQVRFWDLRETGDSEFGR